MSARGKSVDSPPDRGQSEDSESNIAVSSSDIASVTGGPRIPKASSISSTSERQKKFEKAQRCLENAAQVSKRIKEHRRATAELLGKTFEDDDVGDTASEAASIVSERTGYSVATDVSSTSVLSVQDALNLPGISESLANTLKQKEILMERIKQYKEISKRPINKSSPISRRESVAESKDVSLKVTDKSDISQIQNKLKEKENALSLMQVKVKALETTVLDLQETISEKDQIIEAKTKATSLMSDSLSKKEKDSLTLLEDTRQQMTKMQENFIAMESEWKQEKESLLKEIENKNEKISHLKEGNSILENARFEISVAHAKLTEELEIRNKQICELEEKINELSSSKPIVETPKEAIEPEQEKGSLEIANMVELTKRIELLENLNCQIRQTNKELENKLAAVSTEPKSATSSPSKKASPVPTRKGGRNTSVKAKSPWSKISSESLPQETDKKQKQNEVNKLEMIVQSLNKDILDKEYALSEKDTIISELTKSVSEKEAEINELTQKSLEVSQTAVEKVDVGIITEHEENTKLADSQASKESTYTEQSGADSSTDIDNPIEKIQCLEAELKAAHDEIATLNEEIDAANKNMIKVKSNQKLKFKQMQKTIENFSKVSDTNAEIIKLNEEVHQLSQKVAELEEEKGNLQLHLVDYDSGRLSESDTYKKMMEMEGLAEARLKAISILETQKFELVQELHDLQQKNEEMEDKLADMTQIQNEQVCSEMKSVQLEEQIDNLTASKKELELVIENLKLDIEQLNGTIKHLHEEKEEIAHKLEYYIQENIELTDKLEKLSAEKVSSAESIEIVESLTTQEKLEIEQYNKGVSEGQAEGDRVDAPHERNEIGKLVQESAELNSKIELFTQERQEVMERLNKLTSENEALQEKILSLNSQSDVVQQNIETLNNEKQELQALNEDLIKQIEELKKERIEIVKESAETVKPVEEVGESTSQDSQQGNKGAKTVKQLTKDILKLKNTIKEREAEIGDCQMKILSLEEQQQKQKDSLQVVASLEAKLKNFADENECLKEELSNIKQNKEIDNQITQFKETNAKLQQEINRIKEDYNNTLNVRDLRIREMESVMFDYEKQIQSYSSTLHQKDKELSEYINQVTKLNEVSQKLRSTIEVLEEEKSKDQSAELVKSLNKQINAYQKKLADCEDRLRALEEEKLQLLTLKGNLENKNKGLEVELKKLQDALTEKQAQIKTMQVQQDKHAEEIAAIVQESKERDEEIHEIKLQLRKESIENEKLRTSLEEKNNLIKSHSQDNAEINDIKEKLNQISIERDEAREHFTTLETKNKELMEKLKKFAGNLKKKSGMYIEIEGRFNDLQKDLDMKNTELEQLSLQLQGLPALQEKLQCAEEELNRIHSQKSMLEQQLSHDIEIFKNENLALKEKLELQNSKFNESYSSLQSELHSYRDQNNSLLSQMETFHKKAAEYELELKNNLNLETKIQTLENELAQKQQLLNQLQHGHEAKIQEREMYIESLEGEISKYKSRICRLEESISDMESRRNSLERKADQLDNQLQEKQKAYTEYSTHEDELINRLAVLMDHDRVVEKQLHEIDNENRELQNKIQALNDENQQLSKSLYEVQDHCNMLKERASKADAAETDVSNYQAKIWQLECDLTKITNEHQTLLNHNKEYIAGLEAEFSTQIEKTIKEKKALSERYEKMNDRVVELEQHLNEYKTNIQNLNWNLEEISRVNQELTDRMNAEKAPAPDYTDQYISEINKLNAVINSKNEEMSAVTNQSRSLQSSLEGQLHQLNDKLHQVTLETERLISENNAMKENNEHLQNALDISQMQLKELADKKRVTIEMNIPKTEGMFISSTIEALNVDTVARDTNVSAIESQIVSEDSIQPMKASDYFQSQPEGVEEPLIEKKSAYLCYGADSTAKGTASQEDDPFNTDEGWGLGESEIRDEMAYTEFNDQIAKLKKENETLKLDLTANNAKLLKALKKLKELKASNEMITKELKLSKQMSESTFLDNAIEDELKNTVKDLEQKIEELNTELSKEKREKEYIKKQNEVFYNTNDRLQEMKEKMDSELELWKFKFKEANDKLSTVQWEGENKTPEHKPAMSLGSNDSELAEKMIKLEKENDELQTMINDLTTENNKLNSEHSILKEQVRSLNMEIKQLQESTSNNEALNNEIYSLQTENAAILKSKVEIEEHLHKIQTLYNESEQNIEKLKAELEEKTNLFNSEIQQLRLSTNNTEALNIQLTELQKENADILKSKEIIEETVRQTNDLYAETVANYEKLKAEYEELQVRHENYSKEFINKCSEIEEETKNYKSKLDEANSLISSLAAELEEHKSKLIMQEQQTSTSSTHDQDFMMTERFKALEDQFHQLRTQKLEDEQRIKLYEEQINDANAKMQKLNSENDQLLSSVTELRSSISSAMDQRGFEIAELWKQHLAQREADFQKMEQELRAQLLSAEGKYEQLLDNFQSSNQEETNKLVMVEQITALNNKIQDKEVHLVSLQAKYAEAVNELDMLRSEMQDEKVMIENKLFEQQEEYEKQIKALLKKQQEISDEYDQTIRELSLELATVKDVNSKLILDLQEANKARLEIDNTVQHLTAQLQLKDSEVYQKCNEYSIALAHRNEEFENVRKQLIEYEKTIEDLNYEKESELAILRLKMHEDKEFYEKTIKDNDIEKTNLAEALNAKIVECTSLNRQITDLNKQLEEDSEKASQMQVALENQEIEIVTLKDEIDKMQDLLTNSTAKMAKHVRFTSDTKPSADDSISSESSTSKETIDVVPRAELDLALYMLHQRDVRCEELIMELTHLLEERDTLQLRLSDSLRSCEELKSKCKTAGVDLPMPSLEMVSEVTSGMERDQQFVDTHRAQSSRSSSVSELDGEKPSLQAKLSQLRSVRHSRDVTLRHESEQRQLTMRLLHRDVEHLPPAAVEQLAQHTLSRDSQGTSSVLLNWLRGKSTPKIVHNM
ncbi:protein lava lamp [Plutella xylostella]|uniref:protein lava lamp n=1 Tax=Plutella xylostella TaxID=51655 RepID=UPI00203304B8|nr:protein lava lamp [Plutella xylostella]